MDKKILNNKPLVETIFEVRWELQEPAPGIKTDPYYKILIGRLYDKVKDRYPFYESLPTATIPDEIAGYVVQYRFRKGKDEWPLIQIGPGVVTLNNTEEYTWNDFKERINELLDGLYSVYPDSKSNLKISGLLLRYINAIDFDYEKENLVKFLEDQLKVKIQVQESLFKETDVNNSSINIDLRFAFPSKKPKGALHLRFARGKKKNKDALIWETIVQSANQDIPGDEAQIKKWVDDAHELTDKWFFKMIDGELVRRFE